MMSIAAESFGCLVKQLRLSKGLRLADVAKRMGSHKGYVSGIENGKVSPPSPRMTKKLAKILGLDVLDLLEFAWVEKAPKEIQGRLKCRMIGMQGKNALYAYPAATPLSREVIDG
jgi:transcriptional regulator with XRE-family HTH domain